VNQQKKIVPAKTTSQNTASQPTLTNQFTMKGGLLKPQTVQLTTATTSSPNLAPKVVVTTSTGKLISNSNLTNRYQQVSVTSRPATTMSANSAPTSTMANTLSSSSSKTPGKVMSTNELKIMEFIRRQKMLKNQTGTSPVKQYLPQLQPKTTTTTSQTTTAVGGQQNIQKPVMPVKQINSQQLSQQQKLKILQKPVQQPAASTSKVCFVMCE
jgi:hypothetical protein